MSLAKLKIQYETTAPTPSTSQSRGGKGLLNALDFTEKRETVFSSNPSLTPISELLGSQTSNTEKKGKKKIVIRKPGIDCTVTETTRSEVSKASIMTAESYVGEVKQTLSADSYKFFSKTLATYKKTTNFLEMITCLAEIFTDNQRNYHLFRKFYAFVRPQHKKDFDKTCRDLTGKGCGYKEQDSIPKKRLAQEVQGLEEKRRKVQVEHNSKDTKETDKCNKAQDFKKSDQGHLGSGTHLNHGILGNSDCQNSPEKKNSDSTLSSANSATKLDEIIVKRNIFDRFAKKETEKNVQKISESAENIPIEDTKQENLPENVNNMTPGMQVYFKLKETGYTCGWCKKDTSVPLKAQCDHICCMECWKVCIRETKKCPECDGKVKRKQLSRICFPGGPNKGS